MTKGQIWVTIILGFVIVAMAIIGGYAYAGIKSFEDIMNSPAITNEFEIDGEFYTSSADNATTELKINKISGKFSSRLWDLILYLSGEVNND